MSEDFKRGMIRAAEMIEKESKDPNVIDARADFWLEEMAEKIRRRASKVVNISSLEEL